MSEANTNKRATCVVCGKSLGHKLQGWRHVLFCSLECERSAARWQLNQISSVVGHSGVGGAAAPAGKEHPGHADDSATNKPSPR